MATESIQVIKLTTYIYTLPGIERDVWAGIPDVDHTYNVEADDPQ